MERSDLTFVIPTYRLRDVGETVEQYDQHFWRNGHSVPIVVFDDSSPANQASTFRSSSRRARTTSSSTWARARRSSS
jgi:hypothetical protein